MPELPEVETMVRGIRPIAKDAILRQIELCPCPRRPIPIHPTPETLVTLTRNNRIQDVVRVAKRICIKIYKEQASPKRTCHVIVIEPRMTGLVVTSDPPTELHRRLRFHLDRDGNQTGFDFWDRRGLGTVSLLNASEFDQLRNRLGPDALTISPDEFLDRLQRTRSPIKVALLDQTLVAGIGNLYASEILFEARISPLTAASRVSPKRVQAITRATHRILEEAIQYEGSTLGDGTYRTALNQSGGYQNKHRVYDREGERCPGCQRSDIQRIVQAQRSTFFCPRCQK